MYMFFSDIVLIVPFFCLSMSGFIHTSSVSFEGLFVCLFVSQFQGTQRLMPRSCLLVKYNVKAHSRLA